MAQEASKSGVKALAVRVLVVDDDALVRTLLTRILEAQGVRVVGQAGDGDEVLDAVRRTGPDVVLMDLRMERVSGLDATRALALQPDPPGVLALTSFDTKSSVLDAVDAGVAGFLAKDAAPEEIVEAVNMVASGEGALSSRAAKFVLEEMRGTERPREARATRRMMRSLSTREMEAANLVTQGLSNQQIAKRMHVGEATVKTHLAGAMNKLGADNRVQLAVALTRAGVEA